MRISFGLMRNNDLNAPLAIFVSVENEVWLKTFPGLEIQKDEYGKPFLVRCDSCDARFFIFTHLISTVGPWDTKQLLDSATVNLRKLLATEHKLGVDHERNRHFEIT
jgi:hypothetical protein